MYLGSGRYENFYTDGFADVSQVDSAITEFESRVDEIAEGAKNIEVPEGKNRQAEQIRYVHNEIIDNVSYRMEDTCFEGDGENGSNIHIVCTAVIRRNADIQFRKIHIEYFRIICIERIPRGVHRRSQFFIVP